MNRRNVPEYLAHRKEEKSVNQFQSTFFFLIIITVSVTLTFLLFRDILVVVD